MVVACAFNPSGEGEPDGPQGLLANLEESEIQETGERLSQNRLRRMDSGPEARRLGTRHPHEHAHIHGIYFEVKEGAVVFPVTCF